MLMNGMLPSCYSSCDSVCDPLYTDLTVGSCPTLCPPYPYICGGKKKRRRKSRKSKSRRSHHRRKHHYGYATSGLGGGKHSKKKKKKSSNKKHKPNEFIRKSTRARKQKAKSFRYNNKTYHRRRNSKGLIYYKPAK